jgi:hypothetical protein
VLLNDESICVDSIADTASLQNSNISSVLRSFRSCRGRGLTASIQSQQSGAILFSGNVMFAGSTPNFRDVQSRTRGLLDDTPAVQTAVHSNPAIGGGYVCLWCRL